MKGVKYFHLLCRKRVAIHPSQFPCVRFREVFIFFIIQSILMVACSTFGGEIPCVDLIPFHQAGEKRVSLKRGLETKLLGLSYKEIFFNSESKLYDLLYDYDYSKFTYPKVSSLKEKSLSLPLSEIHFMQRSVRYASRKENGGYSVVENAQMLRQGLLVPEDIPTIFVWRDESGKVWTLNHRRLSAFVLAGNIIEIPVQWTNRKDVLSGHLDKFYPVSDGKTTYIVNPKQRWAIQIDVPNVK